MSASLFRKISFLFLTWLSLVHADLANSQEQNAGSEKKNKSVRLCLILGLTGGAAEHADSILKGAQLAQADYKEQGWDIELLVEDDQTNSAKSVAAFQSLLARGCKYFIGPTWSFQVQATKNLFSRHQVLGIGPAASADISGGSAEGLFFLVANRMGQVPAVVDFFRERNLSKGYLVVPTGDWGVVHEEVFRNAIKEVKGEIVGNSDFQYGEDATTFRTAVNRAKQGGADIILFTGAASDSANIVKVMHELRLDIPFLGTDTTWDAAQKGLIDTAGRGAQTYGVGVEISPEFKAKLAAKFPNASPVYADRGYDAVSVYVKGLENTDGSYAAMQRYFIEELNFQGVSGNVSFDDQRELEGTEFVVKPAVGR